MTMSRLFRGQFATMLVSSVTGFVLMTGAITAIQWGDSASAQALINHNSNAPVDFATCKPVCAPATRSILSFAEL
jgi:hypothetical protein